MEEACLVMSCPLGGQQPASIWQREILGNYLVCNLLALSLDFCFLKCASLVLPSVRNFIKRKERKTKGKYRNENLSALNHKRWSDAESLSA